MPSILTVGGTSSVGESPTYGDLIEKVYRRLMGANVEMAVQINQSSGIQSSDTTVIVTGAQQTYIQAGTVFAAELENIYVTSWNAGTSTATIVRGWNGSPAAAHINGTVLYINPRFSRYDIAVAINDDLRSLSSPENGLFRVGVASVTYNPVFAGYDLSALPSNFIDILEVRYTEANPYRFFPSIKSWKVVRWNTTVTDANFPSGNGLVIYETGWPGLPVYITYSAPFISFVNTADGIYATPGTNDEAAPLNGYTTATVGNLTPTMVDLPPLGAEIDLVLPREVSRNFMESQPDPRKAADVPAGAVSGSVNGLILRRAQRISEEAMRLRRQYTRLKSW